MKMVRAHRRSKAGARRQFRITQKLRWRVLFVRTMVSDACHLAFSLSSLVSRL
jgi:hypothetical protein